MATTTISVDLAGLNGVFRFTLDQKTLDLGQLKLRQFWMNIGRLYPTRRPSPKPTNADAVLGVYWDEVNRQAACDDACAQQTHLLARLLPYCRRNRSNAVLADARGWRPGQLVAAAAQLDKALRSDRGQITAIEFRDHTGPALTEITIDAALQQQIQPMWDNFFQQPRRLLRDRPEEAWRLLKAEWDRLYILGRRHGHHREKQFLDVLSYEAKAAFHRAYSVAWRWLMHSLRRYHDATEAELRLVQLWHMDHVFGSSDPQTSFHVFHGHILGLHPIGALLMGGQEAKKIIAAYLEAPTPEDRLPPFHRFLRAAELAVHIYMGEREETKQNRRRRPQLWGNPEDASR